MKTRKAARASITRHTHSELKKISKDTSSKDEDSQDTFYLIEYPIEQEDCRLCNDNLPKVNLKIREHINDVHNIAIIRYKCRSCDKEYDTISSIKSHHPACKRKQLNNLNNNNLAAAANTDPTSVVASNNNNNQNIINIPALQCIECYKKSIDFTAKDRKVLITHMRTKHPNEYEDSKVVANVRVAWSNDEDKILANLEISLKAIHKGQILDRLFNEWNKLVTKCRTNVRSKEAIRGRRQQPEYKAIFAELLSKNNNDDQATDRSPVDSPSSSSESDSESDSNSSTNSTTEQNYTNVIKNLLQNIIIDNRIQISTHMKNAIESFINLNNDTDPVQISINGIYHSLHEIRNKRNNNLNGQQLNRTTAATNKKFPQNKSRIEKAKKRAYYEKLYWKNKSRLMDEIIDGVAPNTNPPPIHIVVQHYEQIWSKLVQDTKPVEPIVNIDSQLDILLSPITKLEINWAIKRTKRDTAKGIDQITIQEAKLLAENDLYIAFNIWLGCKRIPSDLKLNRTTLIPKGNQNLDKITNWRPITISSILLRLFNKIIGYRMSKFFKIDKRQLGFQPINGCSMNVWWLHNLLKHARLNKKSLFVCLIDVAKAFDSIPHASIFRALTRHQAPSSIIELIQNQYSDSYTTITYRDLSSRKIKILRGVKQGDSLSPLLFNLVTDELFSILGNEFGYNISNIGSSNIKCFADDIVLTSGSRIGMGQMLNETVKFLNNRGLEVNPQKCMSIGLEKAYKGKKSKIITESAFTINGTKVPILGHVENSTKYLGIQFTSVGSVHAKVAKDKIKIILDKLLKIPLKPPHKIDLIRSRIIPLFIYQLVNLENYPKLLKQIDMLIRQTIRCILHLPMSLSIEFFYLPVRDGGLQIPKLLDIVGLAKTRIYKQIMRSNDALLKYLVETQGYHYIHRYINELKLDSSFETDDLKQRKIELIKDRRLSYGSKVHGYGLEVFSTCPLTNFWLYGDCKTMSGRTYINAIKLRTNTIETKVTLTRGLSTDKICRLCKTTDESVMHISQFCIHTKGMRYKRHHSICFRVAKKLKERGFATFMEQSFTNVATGLSKLRPDIIATKDGHAYIIDVQCVYESSCASFINARHLKVLKYTPLEQSVKERYHCVNASTHCLVIGSRGSFFHGHIHEWIQFGFSSTELRYISLNCIENTLRVFYSFNRSLHGNNRIDI